MKILPTKLLDNPKLFNRALEITPVGYLFTSNENLTYLDVDDEYIHQLFPLLKNKQFKKPNYFGGELIGAHISAIYPEENTRVNKEDLGQRHEFKVKGIFTARLELKKYYVLIIESSSLLELRRKYGLSDMPFFKGYFVDFHITIAVAQDRRFISTT